MAIVRSLEVNSILWKYIKMNKRPKRDPNHAWKYLTDENGRILYEDVPEYRAIRLYNRRCRNSGCTIERELEPFFNKLKIRLIRYNRESKATAVGCEDYMVRSKEEWDNIELNEVAQAYYKRIKNVEFKNMIKLEEGDIPTRPIQELKSLDLSEPSESTEEEWPEEPSFNDLTPWYVRTGSYV